MLVQDVYHLREEEDHGLGVVCFTVSRPDDSSLRRNTCTQRKTFGKRITKDITALPAVEPPPRTRARRLQSRLVHVPDFAVTVVELHELQHELLSDYAVDFTVSV